VAAAPGALAQKKSCASAKTTGTGGDNRPSLRSGLRLIRALPGEPAFATVTPAKLSASLGLGACMGAPGPHDFAVHERAPLVSQRLHVHRISASRVVTTAIRPSASEAGWGDHTSDSIFRKTEIFLSGGLDCNSCSAPGGQISWAPCSRLAAIGLTAPYNGNAIFQRNKVPTRIHLLAATKEDHDAPTIRRMCRRVPRST
jgi:hypothetical protein